MAKKLREFEIDAILKTIVSKRNEERELTKQKINLPLTKEEQELSNLVDSLETATKTVHYFEEEITNFCRKHFNRTFHYISAPKIRDFIDSIQEERMGEKLPAKIDTEKIRNKIILSSISADFDINAFLTDPDNLL